MTLRERDSRLGEPCHNEPARRTPLNANSLIDLLTALWLGFTGACIGSFLNVVAYRMPLGMSVIWQPSHCPKCKHPIRAYDNVPVLGWLWLRGRCRDCGEPISPRYAIVEATMGLAFFILAYAELFSGGANLPGGPITEFTGAIGNVWDPQWSVIWLYVFHGILLSLLMSAVLIDLDGQRIPGRLIGFGMWIGIFLTMTELRPWTGVDEILGHERIHLFPWVPAAWGAGCGFLAGIAIALLRRVLAKPASKPPSTTRNLLFSYTLIGFLLGDRFVCFAFICTVVTLVITGSILSKGQREKSKIVLPILWLVVVVLIAFWKPLVGLFP